MSFAQRTRPLLLSLLAAAAVPWQAVAVYDTKTGTNYESTSERMSRETQETKDWVAQWSGANLPGAQNSSSYRAPRTLDQGPSVIQRIEAENAAREARIVAERLRHEQWEKERIENENRRALEREFAEEAARRREQEAQWENQERKKLEEPWLKAQRRARERGQELKLSIDEFRTYWHDLGQWWRQRESDPASALRLALIDLNGTYGGSYSPLQATRQFEQCGAIYLAGIATYFAWTDPGLGEISRDTQAKDAPRYRQLAYAGWKRNLSKEKDPLAQKRIAVALLALRLCKLPEAPLSQNAQALIAQVLHRALAAQHAAIGSHPGLLSGNEPDSPVWLDAGLARILWDCFATRPEFAPCAETQTDLLRILEEARDPLSRDRMTITLTMLPDWQPRGALPVFEPNSDALDTLMLAALVAVREKIGPCIELLAIRTETQSSIEASRDSVVGALFHQLIEDRLPEEPIFRELALHCWTLVQPSFEQNPGSGSKPNAMQQTPEMLNAQLRQIIRLATEPFKDAAFFAEVEELTHMKSAPEISARANALAQRLKQAPHDKVSRVELAILVIKHPDLLDQTEIARAATLAVRQSADESLLLPELKNTSPLKDRYLAVLSQTEETKRHPLFWAALTKDQLEDTQAACKILQGISPQTPEALDLMASYVSGRYCFDILFQYKTQLAALSLPAEQRRFSSPRETLAKIYQDLTLPCHEHAAESEAVKLARETLEANPNGPKREEALRQLVRLQQDFDASNVPNETSLQALETAALNESQGTACSAFVDALRSSPAWTELSEQRRLKTRLRDEDSTPDVHFGTWERRIKGWHVLLAALMRKEAWATQAIKSLDVQEAREQLRDLIGSDFGDSFQEGHFIVQAYLATQTTKTSEEWRTALAQLTPLTEARDITRLLSRGVTEPWTTNSSAKPRQTDRYSPDAEACLDCLVLKTERVYRKAIEAGADSDTPPAEEWGQKEVYQTLIALGPQLKKPAKWNDAEQGRFSATCLTLLFEDHWEFLTKQAKGKAIDRALPKRSLEDAIWDADSLMRLRGAEENQTLLTLRDYDLGVDLLTKALAKIPGGASLAKRMIEEEIGPRELIEHLRDMKALP